MYLQYNFRTEWTTASSIDGWTLTKVSGNYDCGFIFGLRLTHRWKAAAFDYIYKIHYYNKQWDWNTYFPIFRFAIIHRL